MNNFSLFIRNLFFTIIQPGIVAGLIPYWILGDRSCSLLTAAFPWYAYPAILIFLTGFIIMVDCIARFAKQGKGTLSPADPTKKLVATGLYRYSRNPMYIGVLLILTGEIVFFQSLYLALYLLIIFELLFTI